MLNPFSSSNIRHPDWKSHLILPLTLMLLFLHKPPNASRAHSNSLYIVQPISYP